MLGTYASFAVALGASALVGQAILSACGWRGWSALAPAVGLAALCPIAWFAIRLPGDGTSAIIVVLVVALAAGTYLPQSRLKRSREIWPAAALVAVAAVVLASLPFIAEGRFGILGTSLNPDMSQHLFAVDRLLEGGSERLIEDGYPLGPHSIVAALSALGPSTVQAFGGLTLAIAAAACIAPLGLLRRRRDGLQLAGALCVGVAYLVAAFLVQGAFKEGMQALFVLAFALGLAELARGDVARGWSIGLPLTALAVGSVYTYSFPGLLWLTGAALVWGTIELLLSRQETRAALSASVDAVGVAVGVLVLLMLPEIGRILDFASFETFDPAGAGLGNLFNRLSPFEALGIWPSGDFRVEPGDGSVPAIVFYLGGALGLAALVFGCARARDREGRALVAALVAALALWLYALVSGTPYQEAKALVVVAPLISLISVRGLLQPGAARPRLAAAAVFLLAAGGSSVLVLANGPVGPSGYSPQLAELNEGLDPGSQLLVIAPDELLDDEHGADWLAWELRGNRVCIEPESGPRPVPGAITITVAQSEDGAVIPEGIYRGTQANGYDCPLIPDAARADPGAGG